VFKRIKSTVKNLLPEGLQDPEGIDPICFAILYDDQPFGTLEYDGSLWRFIYTKMAPSLGVPEITDFPDFTKTYKSASLWPFFASRIPTSKHPEIQDRIKKLGIDKGDYGTLLEHFGQRTSNNPYVLEKIKVA